jgi:hypothetical protein
MLEDFNSLKKILPPKRIRNVFCISDKYKFVYVSNPKAGCTTLKLLLSRWHLEDPNFSAKNLHNRNVLPLLTPAKLTREERDSILKGDYFIFSFVRHPVSRILSAYYSKIVNNKFQKKEILSAMGHCKDDITHQIGLDEFIDVLEKTSDNKMNPHWRPQYLNLLIGHVPYNYIGKLENLCEDINAIREKIAVPDYSIPWKNKINKKIKINEDLTENLKTRIETIYDKDYEIFGYD